MTINPLFRKDAEDFLANLLFQVGKDKDCPLLEYHREKILRLAKIIFRINENHYDSSKIIQEINAQYPPNATTLFSVLKIARELLLPFSSTSSTSFESAKIEACSHAALPAATYLIVDDEKANQRILHKYFQKVLPDSKTFFTADNDKQTFDALEKYGPILDIVCLDDNLGCHSLRGSEMIERLISSHPHIIFLFITSDSSFSLEHIEKLGFDGYLKKPVTPTDLQNSLSDIYKKYSSSAFRGRKKWILPTEE